MTTTITAADGYFWVDCPRRISNYVSQISGTRMTKHGWRLQLNHASWLMLRHLIPSTVIDPSDSYTPGVLLTLSEDAKYRKNLTQDYSRSERSDGLHPHQAAIAEWMLCSPYGLVTAGVRTGKTGATIEAINSGEFGPGPHLIVCPDSLRHNWATTLEQWGYPGSVGVVDGGSVVQKRKTLAEPHDLFIVGFSSLPSLSRLEHYSGASKLTEKEKTSKELNEFDWGVLVVDEAHRLCNPKNKSTRAIWALRKKADRAFALTATPLMNTAKDVWGLLHFLDPQLWSSRGKFLDMFVDVVENYFGFEEIRGLKQETIALLKEITAPLTFHVDPDDVLDLPPVVRQIRYVELAPKARKQYDSLDKKKVLVIGNEEYPIGERIVRQTRKQMIAQGSHLEFAEDGETLLLSARNNAKVAEFMDLLDGIPEGEKVLVFSRFVNILSLAYEKTREVHGEESAAILIGEVDADLRQKEIQRFNENPETRVLFATYACAAEGHNFSAANHTVFLQRSYSFKDNVQAEGRVRSPDQKADTVVVYDIVTKGTVDEDPIEAILNKKEMSDEFIELGVH